MTVPASPPRRARLFGRFEQTERGRRLGGSGLGLAICRELVACMGGEIALDGAALGGTTFLVDLPLPAAEAAVDDRSTIAAAQGAARSAADATPGYSILVVEDDAIVAAVIAGLLQAQGHAVVHACNGLEALAALGDGPVDLALLDLDLPGIDGFALARMLRARQRPAAPRLPLIGVSARSLGSEEGQCLAAGMDAFVRKPVTGDTLAAAIERGVAHARERAIALDDA